MSKVGSRAPALCPLNHHPCCTRLPAAMQLRVRTTGEVTAELPLPGLGSVGGVSGSRKSAEFFFAFTSARGRRGGRGGGRVEEGGQGRAKGRAKGRARDVAVGGSCWVAGAGALAHALPSPAAKCEASTRPPCALPLLQASPSLAPLGVWMPQCQRPRLSSSVPRASKWSMTQQTMRPSRLVLCHRADMLLQWFLASCGHQCPVQPSCRGLVARAGVTAPCGSIAAPHRSTCEHAEV